LLQRAQLLRKIDEETAKRRYHALPLTFDHCAGKLVVSWRAREDR
jgi:hypothetical protein